MVTPGESDMRTATARIAYDGEAVRTGSMDVRQLAPALLEIGAYCDRANFLLNGEEVKISVRVRAEFKLGSFAIDLDVVQTFYEKAKAVLFGDGAQSVKYLLEYLGLVGAGGAVASKALLEIYRKFRGRRPTLLKESGSSVFIDSPEGPLEVPRQVYLLYLDEEVRRHLNGLLSPLGAEGVDRFEVRDPKDPLEGPVAPALISISKEEYQEARRNEAQEQGDQGAEDILDTTYEVALHLAKVPLKQELTTWTFEAPDKSVRISAELKDPIFLEQHSRGETYYRVGDIFVLKLRARSQRTREGALKTSYQVLEVLRHIHPGQQLSLQLKPSTEPGPGKPTGPPRKPRKKSARGASRK